jgi:hypothetical protein
MGVVVGLLIGLLQFVISPATAKQQLEKIDQDLAEARRIAKLESEVAQMRRVRVAPEPIAGADEPEADGDVTAAEPRARR